jgi:ABC-type antimicrobial peptide transport system ATPase subunit
LIVAQRVGTIKNANQILVLSEGKIAGKGSHYSLLNSCEVYREIAASQLSEDEMTEELKIAALSSPPKPRPTARKTNSTKGRKNGKR